MDEAKSCKILQLPLNSTNGWFTPVAGQAGHHLNGFGSLNMRQFTSGDLFRDKKAICLLGTGNGGRVLIYENSFLSPHEFEDVTSNGKSFRAYVRQTYTIPI